MFAFASSASSAPDCSLVSKPGDPRTNKMQEKEKKKQRKADKSRPYHHRRLAVYSPSTLQESILLLSLRKYEDADATLSYVSANTKHQTSNRTNSLSLPCSLSLPYPYPRPIQCFSPVDLICLVAFGGFCQPSFSLVLFSSEICKNCSETSKFCLLKTPHSDLIKTDRNNSSHRTAPYAT